MFDGEKMKRILIIAFLLIILSLVGAVIFYGISTISKLSAEVVASFVTGLIGLSGILLAQWYSKKKEISESHRPAKVEVYERFFDIVETFMADTKSSDSDLDAEDLPAGLVKELTKMSRGMVV
jgi:flagellar basal body-associated protein FliL